MKYVVVMGSYSIGLETTMHFENVLRQPSPFPPLRHLHQMDFQSHE